MKRYTTNTFVAIAVLSMGFASPAVAQSFKDKVIGAWTLESGSENFPDGKEAYSLGNRQSDP